MIRILCLGQLSVLRDGAQLPPGSIQPRRMGLLALLAAAGDRAQGREGLSALLWPESGDERARGSLAQALYALRRDLGSEDAIQGVRELRLNPEFVETDLWDFETHRTAGSLERAVACYAGPFLEGFQLPGLAEFDRWREGERGAWASRHLEVVERLAVDAEKKEDRAGAVRWWRKAAGQDPHNARITIRLMRALARGGDRAGAIRQSEIYAALLERDLELAPDPAVLKEAEAIRKAEGSTRVTGDWPVPSPESSSVQPPVVQQPAVQSPVVQAPAVPPPPTRPTRRPVARHPLLWLAAGLIVLAPAAYLLLRPARAPRPIARRVLVAPLANSTGDTTLRLVGPMVAEWLTRSLSETGLVEVIDSRTMLEATRDGGDEASLRDLALGAGVGTLVVGSVYREGDSLRMDIRLTDASTGRLEGTIGSVYAPVGRPTAALPLLGQKVTGAVAQLFDIELPNRSATSSQPPTWEAYQEFLLGMREFGFDWEATLRHLRRAMELDSTYWQARLWAGNASTNVRRYLAADSIFGSLAAVRDRLGAYDQATLDYFEGGFLRGDWERSYDGARRMFALAPGAGHAVFALGNTAQVVSRPAEAIRVLKTIDLERGWGTAWKIRILSTMARAQHRAADYEAELEVGRRLREADEGMGWLRLVEIRALAALGRRDELQHRIDLAMSLPVTVSTWEPFSPGEMLVLAARELVARDESAAASALYTRAEQWYRALPEPEQRDPGVQRALARIMVAQGRWSEVAASYEALLRTDSTTHEHWGGLGVAAVHLGDTAKATAILARLRTDRTPFHFGAPAVWASRIATALGRKEDAVALLHQAVRSGFTRIYTIHGEAEFAALRGFPPFEEFLKPKG